MKRLFMVIALFYSAALFCSVQEECLCGIDVSCDTKQTIIPFFLRSDGRKYFLAQWRGKDLSIVSTKGQNIFEHPEDVKQSKLGGLLNRMLQFGQRCHENGFSVSDSTHIILGKIFLTQAEQDRFIFEPEKEGVSFDKKGIEWTMTNLKLKQK